MNISIADALGMKKKRLILSFMCRIQMYSTITWTVEEVMKPSSYYTSKKNPITGKN